MTDYPIFEGNLEVRARGNRRVLSGKFPYGATATIRNTGRARKERFAPESMSWQVREFQKLQGELAETIKASIDETRKQLLIEQLEDGLERRNTHLLVGPITTGPSLICGPATCPSVIRGKRSSLRRCCRMNRKCRPGCVMRSWP